MSRPKTWECWTLHADDIGFVAERMGLDFSEFTARQIDEIVRRFKKGLHWAVDDVWEPALSEAIETARGEEKSRET